VTDQSIAIDASSSKIHSNDVIVTDQSVDFDSRTTTTTINEEIRTIEHAPILFELLRKFDNITDAQIQKSLNTDLNRT
jgi:hypothetical protein